MKYIFLLWPDRNYSPEQRRSILLEKCAPEILKKEVDALSMNIDDQFSTVKSPAPKWYKGPAIVATISIYIARPDKQLEDLFLDLFKNYGFKPASYSVEESIYKDYGDNQHFRKRDWPDGERSPTIQAVTLLTRPKKFSQEEWIKRWHGNMSPVSETLQPRARYSRNVVLARSENSPNFDGIVDEAWPSPEHITNPYLFYCADTPWQLLKNMTKLLKAVMHFHQLHKIQTVTMSEYFLKTGSQ